MNQLFHLDSKQRKIIDFVPLLVELGRTAPDGQSKFPHPWPPQIPPGSAAKL
jgi:hypothetical protein